MKINTINSNYQMNTLSQKNNLKDSTNNTKNADVLSYLSTSANAVSFQATRRVPLKSLELQNENAIEIINKVTSKVKCYEEKNIRGNFLKPFMINANGTKYLFSLNNSDPKLTKFEIKNIVDELNESSNLQNNQSLLSFAVDPQGKIVAGELSKKVNDRFTKTFELHKVSENINRIKTNEGMTLQNSRSKDKFTTRVDLCKYKESKEFDMYKDFTDFDSGLSEIFFKLVQGRSLYV